MPEKDKMRGAKNGLKQYEIDNLDPKVRKLHYHLADKFPNDYVMTSGARSKKANPGVAGSKHLHGEALDIRPNEKVYNYLMNTPEGISKLNEAGLGILDETDPRNMKVATGTHFHIGSDFYGATKKRAQQLEEFGPDNLPKTYYFQQQNPDFNYADFVEQRNKKGYRKSEDFDEFAKNYLAKNVYSKYGVNMKNLEYDIYNVYERVTGKSRPNATPDELRNELAEMPPMEGIDDPVMHDHSASFDNKDSEEYKSVKEQNKLLKEQLDWKNKVEEEKQRKLEEQKEMAALRQKENEKLSFLESMTDRPAYVEREKPSEQSQVSGGYNPNPIPQQQMDLPNIWDFGNSQQSFQEGGEVGDPPPTLYVEGEEDPRFTAYKDSLYMNSQNRGRLDIPIDPEGVENFLNSGGDSNNIPIGYTNLGGGEYSYVWADPVQVVEVKKEENKSYDEAYKTADKDRYPTLKSFIYAAKIWNKEGRNVTDEELEEFLNKEKTKKPKTSVVKKAPRKDEEEGAVTKQIPSTKFVWSEKLRMYVPVTRAGQKASIVPK